jgi:hypothetical protein
VSRKTRIDAEETAMVARLLAHLGPYSRDTQNDYLALGRAPDALFFDGVNLSSFEAKLDNWKKAVEQARDHQLVADFSWIVMPSPDRRWVEDTGIGLIDENFRVLVCARRNNPFPMVRNKLIGRYWKRRQTPL